MLAGSPRRRQARVLRWRSAPWDPQHPDWLRLDRELPPDHRVRLLDRLVERLDLQPYLRDFTAGFGTAAWHPAVLLKLALYELDRKVLSPAQWYRDCHEHLPLRWLLRGACPSRASLYACRHRLTPRLLKRLNRQVLHAARRDGLTAAQRASLDGTFTAAKGSRHHLLNLQRLEKRLQLLEQAVADDEAVALDLGRAAQAGKPPCWLARSPQGRRRQLQRYQDARQRLEAKLAEHAKQQSRRAKAKRRPAAKVVISLREPEAVVGKDKTKVVRPLYNTQVVRDLDSPFLLGYGTFASASDTGLLPVMLRRTKALAGTLPKHWLADGLYCSVQDLQVCQRRHVTLYAALKGSAPRPEPTASSPSGRQALPVVAPKYYAKAQFVWNEATGSYTCPAGQPMHRQSQTTDRRPSGAKVPVAIYGTKACGTCPQRPRCTPGKRGRVIKRMEEEPLVEALRQRMASAEGKALYRLRKQTIEREFADMKEHRGLRQFSGFGLNHAETQVGLLVLLSNGKNWVRLGQAANEPAA